MLDWFLWLIVAVLVVIGVVGSMSVSAQRDAKAAILQHIQSVPGFSPSKTVLKSDFVSSTCLGVSIDTTSNQVCFSVNQSVLVVPFSSIHDAEVLVDGSVDVRAVGASIGAISVGEAKATAKIKSVVLRILTDNPNMPRFDVPFIEMGHMGPSDGSEAIAEAEIWRDTMRAIIARSKRSS